jgi:ABC-type sugar transport system permease subunit/ABC-type glycerol-3-phosphate transport system substrate-binding protein
MSSAKIVGLLLLLGLAAWICCPSSVGENDRDHEIPIRFMGQSGPLEGAIDDVIHVFEKESREAHAKDPSVPAYRVIICQNAAQDPTADPTRFITSVAGGVPPDVITFDRYAVAEWSSRGIFQSITPYIQQDLAANRPDAVHPENYYPAAWNEIANPNGGGAVYGVPIDLDTRALYYNKDLLIRAGFVDAAGQAQPPRTWEELASMAVKLTERDASGRMTRLGFAPNYGNSWLYLYGWLNGGEFMSTDGRTVTLDDPRIVQALTWVKSVYDSLGGAQEVYGFQSAFQGSALDPFILGQVVMKISNSSEFADTLAQYGQNLNYGMAPPPLPAAELAKGRSNVSWVGGWCYAMPSTSKQKEGAWALIRFLSSASTQKLISESERLIMESQGRVYIPAQLANRPLNEEAFRHYIYERPGMDPKVQAAAHVFNNLIQYARYRPVTPVGQLMWNQQADATENAVFGRATPKDALTTGTIITQRALDKALQPPAGTVVNWSWFFVGYGILLAVVAGGIFYWDSRRGGEAGGQLDRALWSGGWISASPWIFGFICFTGGPILFSLVISFCDYDSINPARFIGTSNYANMLGHDPLFWKSFGNTLYMIIGVLGGMSLSLGIALLLNQNVKGLAVWRSIFYIPSVVPLVAASILWIWILNPSSGLMNNFLASIGIHGPNWLADPQTSKLSLILMGLWMSGGGIVIWIAGLKGISETYYEAATLDGANAWQQFRHVTLPMLSPYIFFNLIMGLIGTFQVFTQAFIMTHGGPANSTLFFVYHLFNNAFRYLNMGYAAAMAWFLFIIIMGLTYVQMRFSKRWVHYEAD